ncbi:GNAT family N-acetyltransferase [Cellulophaga baltica]|uniref:GNAT family N-acetyltransferase n=1 Tax=Cellulophaga TaxID=104264 RepID=UPI001C064B84|nr:MULTISPECIES: GNAT family protein [Cellulophaga]MBU2996093.1 GNAT family N-acetyltransferase [Cellulophaga baltica]MDO6767488.1 GNAT family protein [Cellulophaga sp. 1_MG-2023]
MINTTIPILENEHVRLEALTLDNYTHLIPIAKQEKLVQYSPSDIETPDTLKKYVQTALKQHEAKTSIPFIIFNKKTQKYAGSTRFMNINWKNKVLHIGATWIGIEYHGTGLNTQMKHLMIDYAFNELNFEKIEFNIDERNIKSRKAVEKLGCSLEGVLRKNVYLLDGFKRNTCCYGILKEEWVNNK